MAAAVTAAVLGFVLLPLLAVAPSPAGAAPSDFTLTMVSGTGQATIAGNPEPLVIADPTTVTGTLDGGFDGTGAVSGVVMSTPNIEFQRENAGTPVDVVAKFSQPTVGSGSVVVGDDGRAAVAVDVSLDLQLDLDVGGALFLVCESKPIHLELRSPLDAPYDPETGQVTVVDEQFTIPPVVGTERCLDIAVPIVNAQLAGSNNSISLTFEGDLELPPPPGEPSATTVTAADNPTLLGSPATFTATVAAGEGAEVDDELPTGEVEFFVDGDVSLGRSPLNASQQASITTSTLPAGTHQVTARYLGDTVFSGSQSAPLTHTIQATPNLTATIPGEIVVGAPASNSEIPIVISNPATGANQPNLRLDLTFGDQGSLANGNLVLEHEASPGNWQPIPLTGSFRQTGSYGGLTGFTLAAGQTRQIKLRLSAIATSGQGVVPVAMRLVRVDPVSGAVLTTLSTKNGTTTIVPVTRRPTSIAMLIGPNMPNPLAVRQGYTVGIEARIDRGPSPIPPIGGETQIFIDGVLTRSSANSSDPDISGTLSRVPQFNTGFVIFYIPRSVTRELSPGVHTAQVRYAGDAVYAPSVSPEFTFTILTQPTTTPYQCTMGSPVGTAVMASRVIITGGIPGVVPAGSSITPSRGTIDLVTEGRQFATAAGFFPLPGTTTFIDMGGQSGAGTFSSLVTTSTTPLEIGSTLGGIEVAIPIEGAPGDVVDITLDAVGFNAGPNPSLRIPVNCTPVGEASSLGQVTIAGTTAAVDRAAVTVGDAVTLTAEVFPASAQGQVEFFDGETSLGIAPVVDGVAVYRTRTLPVGERGVTARHLGDLVQPPTTSEPVVVSVRAIDCEAFAEEGHGATVRLVYVELLGRCPDQAGFGHWVGRLEGGTTPGAFARSIAYTPEALGVVVDDAYLTMLGRPADAVGRAFWVQRLGGHGRYDQLLADLGASDEFWVQAGSTNEGFVTRVYDRLLHRTPDEAGLDYWVGRLAAGASRGSLIVSLANLDEPLGVLVAGSYGEILGRTPSTAERSEGIMHLRATGDRSGLYAELIGRPEFATRAQGFPNRHT